MRTDKTPDLQDYTNTGEISFNPEFVKPIRPITDMKVFELSDGHFKESLANLDLGILLKPNSMRNHRRPGHATIHSAKPIKMSTSEWDTFWKRQTEMQKYLAQAATKPGTKLVQGSRMVPEWAAFWKRQIKMQRELAWKCVASEIRNTTHQTKSPDASQPCPQQS